jgi:hypothetical protein
MSATTGVIARYGYAGNCETDDRRDPHQSVSTAVTCQIDI